MNQKIDEGETQKRTSPSHKFGQLIGYVLELAIEPFLQEFANQNSLYLDRKGPRPLRGKKIEVKWSDINNNTHKLDFVLERNGSAWQQGNPVAFIEAAWRKNDKHAKNKAQEIEAALFHLAARYKDFHPFRGVILAGDFTTTSLAQLKTGGFGVLYFTKTEIMNVLSKFGVDGRYEDKTTLDEIRKKILQFEAIPDKSLIGSELVKQYRGKIDTFLLELQNVVGRTITEIHILPLYGGLNVLTTVLEAINFIISHDEFKASTNFVRYEIMIRYSNGDEVNGKYKSKGDVVNFLNLFS